MTPGDSLRLSTGEREDAVRALGEHMSTGRLEIAEYEQRVGDVFTAETIGALRPLFMDLPLPHPKVLMPVKSAPPTPRPVPPPTPLVVYTQPPLPVRTHSRGERQVAGVIQLILPFGIGRFILGDNQIGKWQLITALLGVGILWCFIDGIVLLASDPGRR